jgi:hypothetical protein
MPLFRAFVMFRGLTPQVPCMYLSVDCFNRSFLPSPPSFMLPLWYLARSVGQSELVTTHPLELLMIISPKADEDEGGPALIVSYPSFSKPSLFVDLLG